METLYSTCTVSKESGLSARQLYYWELIGLILPRYETFGMRRFRRYTQEDLQNLKLAKQLLDQGYTLQAVKQAVLSDGTRYLLQQKVPGTIGANGNAVHS